MRRNAGEHWMRAGGFARLGLALVVCACGPELDPLSERCLQALEYREPAHGDVDITESYPTPSGVAVAIRYLVETDAGTERPQTITCDFAAGERWSFTRITLRERELSEAELALVNSEFLLRDLDRHPERFSDGPAARAAPVHFEIADPPERDETPPRSRFSRDLSWIGSPPPADSQL